VCKTTLAYKFLEQHRTTEIEDREYTVDVARECCREPEVQRKITSAPARSLSMINGITAGSNDSIPKLTATLANSSATLEGHRALEAIWENGSFACGKGDVLGQGGIRECEKVEQCWCAFRFIKAAIS